MLVWCIRHLLKLFDDLLCKLRESVLREGIKSALTTLLIEVLDEYALDTQLSKIDRVLKVFDLHAEDTLYRHITVLWIDHKADLLRQSLLHLRPRLIVPYKLWLL